MINLNPSNYKSYTQQLQEGRRKRFLTGPAIQAQNAPLPAQTMTATERLQAAREPVVQKQTEPTIINVPEVDYDKIAKIYQEQSGQLENAPKTSETSESSPSEDYNYDIDYTGLLEKSLGQSGIDVTTRGTDWESYAGRYFGEDIAPPASDIYFNYGGNEYYVGPGEDIYNRELWTDVNPPEEDITQPPKEEPPEPKEEPKTQYNNQDLLLFEREIVGRTPTSSVEWAHLVAADPNRAEQLNKLHGNLEGYELGKKLVEQYPWRYRGSLTSGGGGISEVGVGGGQGI